MLRVNAQPVTRNPQLFIYNSQYPLVNAGIEPVGVAHKLAPGYYNIQPRFFLVSASRR
jgi:hypothetical protein